MLSEFSFQTLHFTTCHWKRPHKTHKGLVKLEEHKGNPNIPASNGHFAYKWDKIEIVKLYIFTRSNQISSLYMVLDSICIAMRFCSLCLNQCGWKLKTGALFCMCHTRYTHLRTSNRFVTAEIPIFEEYLIDCLLKYLVESRSGY